MNANFKLSKGVKDSHFILLHFHLLLYLIVVILSFNFILAII